VVVPRTAGWAVSRRAAPGTLEIGPPGPADAPHGA